MKILLICLVVFFLMGIFSLAAVFYIGYRVKNKVEQTAKDNGIDLRDLATPSPSGRSVDPCSLLSKEEASEILAVSVVRAERTGNDCQFYAEDSTPYFVISTSENGKQQLATMKIVMGGLAGKAGAPSMEALRGIGDEALLGPMDSMLLVVKNGTGLSIDMRQVPQAKDRGIEIAKKAVPRM
ncbi:MAG TPA: hypothetical protein VM120_24585 [Bryobacteraceae bacterium]|nr:hypothetical protein [Bryobacteraceae bacterium]